MQRHCSWHTAVWFRISVCYLGLSGPAAASSPPPQSSVNLAAAKGVTIKASSEVGLLRGKDHTARSVIDGRTTDGYWCPAFKSKPPHWLELDFGKKNCFDSVVLHLYEQTAVQSCRVDFWDGTDWKSMAEMKSTPRPTRDFSPAWEFSEAASGIVRCRFPAVTSDRLRLWFQKDSSVRIYEVEVFQSNKGLPAATAAPDRLDPHSTLTRIAFGHREDGLPPGWITVAAASRYTPQQGIGWLGEGNRADCDRHSGAPVGRTFVAGWGAPGRLRLDLPPGRYFVALLATDFMLPVRPFHVEGAGLSSGRPLATVSRGAWEVRRFRVEAGTSGAELTFRGDKAWLVNALLVASEANLNALLAEADRWEEQLAFGSPDWMVKRKLIPAPARTKASVPDSDRQRGYTLFACQPAQRVYPETFPTPDEIGQKLTLQAAPGEAGVISIGLLPHRGLFNMQLAAGDLAGPAAARIPASALDLRVVRCWPQIDKTPAGKGKVQVIPELLEAQDRHPALCAPEGTTRQYWVAVRVPRDAIAGQYRGQLRFSADGVPPVAIPLELTVLPFQLQTPPEKTFFMYSILSDFDDADILSLMADMRAHGMNSLAPDLVGTWEKNPAGKPRFDSEPLRRVLRLAKQAGFTGPMPWHAANPIKGIEAPEGSEAWNAALANLLNEVRRVQQEIGGQELLFYPVDEPFGHEDRLTLAERAMRVARQAKTLRTYCTPAEKDIVRLGSLLDVRCYAIGSVTSVPEAAASTQKAGAKFWWYTNAARELPEVRRYLAGVWFWSTGADGQGYWVYQSRWQRSRPFQDLEGDLHAHDYAAYPDVDGPIPTIQWECIRQGIDDARYLYTLEAAIAAAKGSPKAAAAERFLAGLRASMPQSTKLADGKSILYDCPWKAAQFSQFRQDVVRHILELQSR